MCTFSYAVGCGLAQACVQFAIDADALWKLGTTLHTREQVLRQAERDCWAGPRLQAHRIRVG